MKVVLSLKIAVEGGGTGKWFSLCRLYIFIASEGAVTKPRIMTITTRRTALLSHNNNVSAHNTNDFCPYTKNMKKSNDNKVLLGEERER